MGVSENPAAPVRAFLASMPWLRAIALPILRQLDRPMTITNAQAGMPLHLLSYTHKGYWYYGKSRAAATMRRFQQFVRPGDTIIEAGGHIGYVAQYLSKLTGPQGSVHVFEPGMQNTEFLTRNLAALRNTLHVKAALSDTNGEADFFEENIGGFLNSLDPRFVKDSAQGRRRAGQLAVRRCTVATLRLDDYTLRHRVVPDFLKIDVEGSEFAVLSGAESTLQHTRALMVEVSRDREAIFEFLHDHGFTLSDENGAPLRTPAALSGNVFAERRRRLTDDAQRPADQQETRRPRRTPTPAHSLAQANPPFR